MGKNLSPIWPGSHCLNSAKHRPLTAWNHAWGEMKISFRDLLWSFIRHIFQRIILADTTEIIKLMKRTQQKKRTWWNKNHSETVHRSENLRRGRGVLHKLSNRGHLRINMHLFPANGRGAAGFKQISLNLNCKFKWLFIVAFSGEQNLKRDYSLFLRKGRWSLLFHPVRGVKRLLYFSYNTNL